MPTQDPVAPWRSHRCFCWPRKPPHWLPNGEQMQWQEHMFLLMATLYSGPVVSVGLASRELTHHVYQDPKWKPLKNKKSAKIQSFYLFAVKPCGFQNCRAVFRTEQTTSRLRRGPLFAHVSQYILGQTWERQEPLCDPEVGLSVLKTALQSWSYAVLSQKGKNVGYGCFKSGFKFEPQNSSIYGAWYSRYLWGVMRLVLSFPCFACVMQGVAAHHHSVSQAQWEDIGGSGQKQ